MKKTGRDLGLLVAGVLLLLSVRVSVKPGSDPTPPVHAAQPAVLQVTAPADAPAEPADEATPHVEVRVLRVEVIRDLRVLRDAVTLRLPDLHRCAS